jgi:putative DNA methylase
MKDCARLIEVAFPLQQASIDSVHEKNVRHGHISTLHIWPARRPLAACRAALIATLLPDPGNAEERMELLEKLGGKVVKQIKKKRMPTGKVEEMEVDETEGGILHWGRETENRETVEWFRQKIREAYGGRAPRVLDPFAGGGAIPLEAMRLGCEVTAIDINPVAWFILKCTLEYPQKLAGQTRPLPSFVLQDREFMEAFLKAKGLKGKRLQSQLEKLRLGDNPEPELTHLELEEFDLEADLAWHVRAWGWWVLNRARKELAPYYPTYAEWEPLDKDGVEWEKRELRLAPMREDGTVDQEALNAGLDESYLKDRRNPQWIAKPTVAYLWARTVTCKNCRATVPLLKTRWLCKKDKKRVLLTMEPNDDGTGVVFGIETNVPLVGANPAQRREHDKRIGAGTMYRSGAACPLCLTIQPNEDLRLEGQAERLGTALTAVVVEGNGGKEYRRPTEYEVKVAGETGELIQTIVTDVPFGFPNEAVPRGASRTTGGSAFTVYLYGFTQWCQLFCPRQLLSLGAFVKHSRCAGEAMRAVGCSSEWMEAVGAYLAAMHDRLANQSSTVCRWNQGGEKIEGTFARFALPILWDFAEVNPLGHTTGGYRSAFDWVTLVVDHCIKATEDRPTPHTMCQSATKLPACDIDVIVTDPPYYDAIPYAGLMSFFHVWLRRTLYNLSSEIDFAFREPTGPEWDHDQNDGELVDDESRFSGDSAKSKAAYEDGMFRSFQACHRALAPEGRLVIVFAHKQPDAWETLVSAIIKAGFIVDASWPIQTERSARTRSLSSAALSSSVWLVCKKRPVTARAGWDSRVLEEMREKIAVRLREFWDAGIRGPDFVWAATGPAMEAYSQYPVVKKANVPGAPPMSVSEFLRHVRRIVVDFVVGRVLSEGGGEEVAGSLDDVTTYYLLHRHDFRMEDAPSGACILYAVSCGLSDAALADQFDLLARTGGQAEADVEEDGADGDADGVVEEGTGSKVRLKAWQQRARRGMGYEAVNGRPVPLIDQVHRLMHLWRAGDQVEVNAYIDERGLRRNTLFHQVLQALIELSPAGSEERSILERISNHLGLLGVGAEKRQLELATS